MEAVVEEQGHPRADHEIEYEDATVSIDQDEEFDFDIGGPEDNLDTEAGAAATDESLAYRVNGSDALDSTYTYQAPDAGAQQPVGESHGQGNDVHDGQDVFDPSEYDAAAETEALGEDWQGDHLEGDNDIHQVEEGQLGEYELHEDEISYEETAAEFEGFDNAAQPDSEQAHDTMYTATSVEYAHHEENHDEGLTDAGDDIGAQVEGDREPQESDRSHDMGDNEATIVTDLSGKSRVDDFEAHADAEDDRPVTQQQEAGSVDDSLAPASWDGNGYEDQQHSDEQPYIRVFWRTEEFRLFAQSPVDDPDTYFLKGLDSLRQPLSQFLAGLRQVIANELAPSEEIFVKVDGLGLEFGETTTTDFLEKTTFGQILDLHNRLVKLDGGSESQELYLYLDARLNCLHRFDELTKGAQEGKGLSHFALYHEDASTDMPADEDEDDQDEGPQDIYSDDVSVNEPDNDLQGAVDETRQEEQPYNPFRITETQRYAIESASFSGLAGESGEKTSSSPDATGAHSNDDGIGNADPGPGEDQAGLDFDETDSSDDAPIDENLQDTIAGLDEAKDVATEELGEDYEVKGDDEQDVLNDEVIGGETTADVQEEDSPEQHDPTDGEKPFFYESSECSAPRICYCDECISSDYVSASLQSISPTGFGLSQVSAHQLPGDGHSAAQQGASTTRSPIGVSSLTATDLETLSAEYYNFYIKDYSAANFQAQDHEAAENDDYLDLDNDNVDTTGDKPLEGTERSGTPGAITHDSSATATLDGEDHGNENGAHVAHDFADASHGVEASNQLDVDASQDEVDEIDWKEDGEDDEDDVADQNPTDLSPSSISVKRSRQADEDDDGLGGESTVKRRRT